jgi:EF hand
MPLGSLLLIWASHAAGLGGAPDPVPRSWIRDGYQAVLAAYDRDGDRALSRAEWTAMVGVSFPAQPRPGEEASNYGEVRADLIGLLDQMDTDRDGKVTLDELIREPLATFDCMDSDRDLRLSQAEIQSGMERCPSMSMNSTGSISAPPAGGSPTH